MQVPAFCMYDTSEFNQLAYGFQWSRVERDWLAGSLLEKHPLSSFVINYWWRLSQFPSEDREKIQNKSNFVLYRRGFFVKNQCTYDGTGKSCTSKDKKQPTPNKKGGKESKIQSYKNFNSSYRCVSEVQLGYKWAMRDGEVVGSFNFDTNTLVICNLKQIIES